MNSIFLRRYRIREQACQFGMTLLELLIAVIMLMSFTGVVVMVMEFSLSFLMETDLTKIEMDDPDVNVNGVLIDHVDAQWSMDKLIKVLSQPGISRKDIVAMTETCSMNLGEDWNNMLADISPPSRYKFCLSSTTKKEGEWVDLLNDDEPEVGVYLLQALPKDKIDASRLPVRRLFCRPRPFC